MLFVDNENCNDPRVNLALEEYLLRNIAPDEDILLFYINRPSIIIGRNQNTVEEINVDYVQANNIHVVRRLSGGGAVYHDLGNLNFSFITPVAEGIFHNFRLFTAPVIRVLNEMGVSAELSGRNDILVDGRKISGNAQYSTGKRMFSHGTLLYSSDLSHVSDALRVKASKIESKGIKSIRSRVANITEFMSDPPDILTFRQQILQGVFAGMDTIPQYHLSEKDWEAVNALSASRYQTWEWNYGRSPAFNIHRTQRFPIGEIDARLDVEKGTIQNIKFYGDFLGQGEVSELEALLTGTRYDAEALKEKLADVDVSRYFGPISTEEMIQLLY